MMQRRPFQESHRRRFSDQIPTTLVPPFVSPKNGCVTERRKVKASTTDTWIQSFDRFRCQQSTSNLTRGWAIQLVVVGFLVSYLLGVFTTFLFVGFDARSRDYSAPFWKKHSLGQNGTPTVGLVAPETRKRRATLQTDNSNLLTLEQLKLPVELIDTSVLRYELPASESPTKSVWKQGWDLLPNEKPLYIVVVPHSHWDSTTRQLSRTECLHRASGMWTTIITALWKDERRTFCGAEVASLAHWWAAQDTTVRQMVLTLLTNGQLELVHGGWAPSPDEAITTLYGLEASWSYGFDWIRTNLGEAFVPKVSWVLDAYGYSPSVAYMWKQKFNGTAMFIHRVHYSVKNALARRRHLEFFWRQTWDDGDPNHSPLGGMSELNDTFVIDTVNGQRLRPHDIFTHIMPFYSFDIPHTCGPDPKLCCQFDFERGVKPPAPTCPWGVPPETITDQNVAERARVLLDQYRKKASLYRSTTLLVPLGDEFRYLTSKDAEAQYVNYQTIFDYMNANLGVQIQFGTLSEYVRATRISFDGPVPILKGSFFPYGDVDNDYWTGYYSSRPFDKSMGRQLERVLYAAESMGASSSALIEPRHTLAMFQEHNAITGTAKSPILDEYASNIFNAIATTHEWMLQSLQRTHQLDRFGVASDLGEIRPCWASLRPRVMSNNLCTDTSFVYNPIDTKQWCGDTAVPGRQWINASLPCDRPGPTPTSRTKFVFDSSSGLMLEPIREEWLVWNVEKGGAYLFAGGTQQRYNFSRDRYTISEGGFVLSTPFWKRTVTEKDVATLPGGDTATVLDFVYETDIRPSNHEWVVRFSAEVANEGYFFTDLNGFNVDTHRFRKDMPVQSQVHPMSSMAAIQDSRVRMTVMSDHPHGTISLQAGSMDVWLDRTLDQDDGRGMGVAMNDNRRVRSRLRVVLEHDGYNKERTDSYAMTPLGRRMMNEVQHPLEMFGKHKQQDNKFSTYLMDAYRKFETNLASENAIEAVFKNRRPTQKWHGDSTARDITTTLHNVPNTVIPFVYMVYKRVDYLKAAMESLRNSDFPRERVHVIISHDGHVPEITAYVESLKTEFQVQQLFHPHACFDHPDSFPGDDPSLNEGYVGDAYGNPRAYWVTCCKHHFTWLVKTVFTDEAYLTKKVDMFLFLEEDYVVAPTIYQALVNGLNAMDQFGAESRGGFLGLSLDPTGGGAKPVLRRGVPNAWNVLPFVSGPMTLHRSSFVQLQNHSAYYCGIDGFDEYNWDWSFVHMQNKFLLPHTVLSPSNVQLARHIGIEGGMHGHKKSKSDPVSTVDFEKLTASFTGTRVMGSAWINPTPMKKGNGGWGHPVDQEHCLRLLSPENSTMAR